MYVTAAMVMSAFLILRLNDRVKVCIYMIDIGYNTTQCVLSTKINRASNL